MVDQIARSQANMRVLFLGQCLLYGYQRVGSKVTFPQVAASLLRNRFPNLKFTFDLKYLYHPVGLKAILKHRLRFWEPDVVVIMLPALFAATSWRVNIIYEMAPELVDTARSFLFKLEAKRLGTEHPRKMTTALDKAFAVRPPLTVHEYEALVEDAINVCKQKSECRFILMGPGRFNEDSIEDYALHSPELWRSINEMVARVGKRLDVAVIDAQDALQEHGFEVFTPNNHRWSVYGHEVVAREVEAVLARQVAELSRSGAA